MLVAVAEVVTTLLRLSCGDAFVVFVGELMQITNETKRTFNETIVRLNLTAPLDHISAVGVFRNIACRCYILWCTNVCSFASCETCQHGGSFANRRSMLVL